MVLSGGILQIKMLYTGLLLAVATTWVAAQTPGQASGGGETGPGGL
jgi:hypothetical protein